MRNEQRPDNIRIGSHFLGWSKDLGLINVPAGALPYVWTQTGVPTLLQL